MREHLDRALMVVIGRVVVNHFVQRGARRHRIEPENHSDQQAGDYCLAEPVEMALGPLHSGFQTEMWK
ncbi:MAG TPA: hypothetical protein VN836_09690 [Verrucomicrobiae bacterium]|nr:hypothetical protein [Verrucomicrobiae bacterium]